MCVLITFYCISSRHRHRESWDFPASLDTMSSWCTTCCQVERLCYLVWHWRDVSVWQHTPMIQALATVQTIDMHVKLIGLSSCPVWQRFLLTCEINASLSMDVYGNKIVNPCIKAHLNINGRLSGVSGFHMLYFFSISMFKLNSYCFVFWLYSP